MTAGRVTEVIFAKGHANVQATHPSTLEFTREQHVSREGDCLVAVAADKAGVDLSWEFKDKLLRDDAKLLILIEAGDCCDVVTAFGSSRLRLVHASDLVVRKSDFVCGRTLGVRADKSSADLSRRLVDVLRRGEKVKITLTVEC